MINKFKETRQYDVTSFLQIRGFTSKVLGLPHTRKEVTMKNVYYVGMDVHKETVELSVLLNRRKEPEFERQLPNNKQKIIKVLKKLQEQGEVMACYEAGCMEQVYR